MFMMYIMTVMSIAETRQHLSEILGKVAYGGEAFVITKKGRPMARLVPIPKTKSSSKRPKTLGEIKGWLSDDDPFFRNLELARELSRNQNPTNPFGRRKRK
jgi:prevent-host-death family protein